MWRQSCRWHPWVLRGRRRACLPWRCSCFLYDCHSEDTTSCASPWPEKAIIDRVQSDCISKCHLQNGSHLGYHFAGDILKCIFSNENDFDLTSTEVCSNWQWSQHQLRGLVHTARQHVITWISDESVDWLRYHPTSVNTSWIINEMAEILKIIIWISDS